MKTTTDNKRKDASIIVNNVFDIWFKMIITLVVIYICFSKFWEELLLNSLYPFLSKFRDTWATKFFFILAIAFLIYDFSKKLRKGVVISWHEFWLGVVVFSFWCYYRLLNPSVFQDCTTVFFVGSNHLCYIDLLFIWAVKQILYKIIFCLKHTKLVNRKSSQMSFYCDAPISSLDGDMLGMEAQASILVDRLYETSSSQNAFSIGIVSPWGYGKSSFLFCMKEKFKQKEKVLIFDFNPWKYNKNASLTEVFFHQMKEVLQPYYRDIGYELLKYSRLLNGSSVPALQLFFNFTNQDINEIFKDIDRKIKKTDYKIVVFIDDLDRMDGGEIMEVLKLVRNSANFANLYFIVAYDRDYLNKILNTTSSADMSNYLEKIFQIEYTLSPIEPDKLKSVLKDKLKKTIDNESDRTMSFDLIDGSSYFNNKASSFPIHLLHSIRDVYRYINLFSYSYCGLKGNIQVNNLMDVTLLQLKHPAIFELLSNKLYEFIDQDKDDQTRVILYHGDESNDKDIKINEGGKSTDSQSDRKVRMRMTKFHSIDFLSYLDENKGSLRLTNNDINDIKELMLKLFPDRGSHLAPTYKSIQHIESVERYFYYSLLETDLAVNEFKELWRFSDEEMESKIKSIIERKKERSLIIQIRGFRSEQAIEIKKVIHVLFYLGSQNTIESRLVFIEDIEKKISMLEESYRQEHDRVNEVSEENGTNEADEFVRTILLRFGWNNFVEDFLRTYINTFDPQKCQYEFYQRVQLKLFSKYLESPEIEVRDAFDAYLGHNISTPTLRNVDVKNKFISYAKMHIDKIINENVLFRPLVDKKKFYIPSYIARIWQPFKIDVFNKHVQRKAENEGQLSKFKSFIDRFKSKGYLLSQWESLTIELNKLTLTDCEVEEFRSFWSGIVEDAAFLKWKECDELILSLGSNTGVEELKDNWNKNLSSQEFSSIKWNDIDDIIQELPQKELIEGIKEFDNSANKSEEEDLRSLLETTALDRFILSPLQQLLGQNKNSFSSYRDSEIGGYIAGLPDGEKFDKIKKTWNELKEIGYPSLYWLEADLFFKEMPDSSSDISEFKKFWHEFKKAGYPSDGIAFDFKEINSDNIRVG